MAKVERQIRGRKVVIGHFIDQGFDLLRVDFLFLQKLLFIDIVLLRCQFLATGHCEKF